MPGRQPKVHYRNSNIGIIEPSWKLSTLHLFYEKYLHLFIYLYIHIIQREMRYGERDVSPRRRRRNWRMKMQLLIFPQRLSGRRHQAVLPMTPSDRWLFPSQVMNHVSAVRPRSRSDETNFGMNLCAFWLFARGTDRSPLSAPGLGVISSLSSTFSLFTCYTFKAGECLPPPQLQLKSLKWHF